MLVKYRKYIIFFLLAPVLLLALTTRAQARYSVNGLVEFTYRAYETKIGNTRSSSSSFTQSYHANLSTDLWDPRFLQVSAGINYGRTNSKGGATSDTLGYNVNMLFFPRMKVSGEVFASRNTTNFSTYSNIQGYDITSTSYGGTLNYRPYNNGFNGRNNYNNSNNNNADNDWGRTKRQILPNITLAYIHSEAEADSAANPVKESRDNTHAQINYRTSQSFTLDIDDRLEEYNNAVTGNSYKTNTANLNSTMRFSPDADGTFSARSTVRDARNMPGYGGKETALNYGAGLNFREKARFSHYYNYNYGTSKNDVAEYSRQDINANMKYRIIDSITLRGSFGSALSESEMFSSPTTSAQSASTKSTTATAGLDYNKLYRPDFLGPFSFSTGYAVMQGYKSVSSDTAIGDGSGYYYSNSLSLGLNSPGWKQDQMAVNYNYYSLRDHSPEWANSHTEQLSLNLSTRRIPKTTVQASGLYMTAQNTASTVAAGNVALAADTKAQRRSVIYQASANLQANEYFRLGVGANRGQTTTQQYTLSTVAAQSQTISDDKTYYGDANLYVPFTRFLVCQVSAREEIRDSLTQHATAHIIDSSLKYQIRKVFLSFDYKWRQDAPDNQPRSTQQLYYISLKRPF